MHAARGDRRMRRSSQVRAGGSIPEKPSLHPHDPMACNMPQFPVFADMAFRAAGIGGDQDRPHQFHGARRQPAAVPCHKAAWSPTSWPASCTSCSSASGPTKRRRATPTGLLPLPGTSSARPREGNGAAECSGTGRRALPRRSPRRDGGQKAADRAPGGPVREVQRGGEREDTVHRGSAGRGARRLLDVGVRPALLRHRHPPVWRGRPQLPAPAHHRGALRVDREGSHRGRGGA